VTGNKVDGQFSVFNSEELIKTYEAHLFFVRYWNTEGLGKWG